LKYGYLQLSQYSLKKSRSKTALFCRIYSIECG
jgi:hypothetical protein